jgi:hypothetical protein
MTDADTPATASPVAYDPWDSTGEGMWFCHIDPDTLEGLWSEEQETLYINYDGSRETRGYWLSQPGAAGQDPFETLELAKAAGTAIMLKAQADMPAKMLADAGLDDSLWAFQYQDGARFINDTDPTLVIEIDTEGRSDDNRFSALADGHEVGTYGTASEAASVLVNRPAPGI